MLNLEKLYDSAEKNLTKKKQNWLSFTDDFKKIFCSEMTLYCSTLDNSGMSASSYDDVIATSNPKAIKQYFEDGFHEYSAILPDPKNPFEPAKRTDSLSDSEFIKIEVTQKFLLPNNFFYLMVIFSILPDGSSLVLFVTRGEGEVDFSDEEKQRLALFMRYLATLIKATGSINLQAPDVEIKNFGQKYNLTETEVEILSALLQGRSLKMIAEETNRSYGTVRWHVQNILEKCQVRTQKNLLSEFYSLIKA